MGARHSHPPVFPRSKSVYPASQKQEDKKDCTLKRLSSLFSLKSGSEPPRPHILTALPSDPSFLFLSARGEITCPISRSVGRSVQGWDEAEWGDLESGCREGSGGRRYLEMAAGAQTHGHGQESFFVCLGNLNSFGGYPWPQVKKLKCRRP